MTHQRQSWETFGGDFIKATNGKYYTAAGKTFHAISRVEGLDDFAIRTQPLSITPEQQRLNTRGREVLVMQGRALAAARGKQIEIAKIASRTNDFQLDGLVEEWGTPNRMTPIGPEKAGNKSDAAYDERGLYLVLMGETPSGNSASKTHDGWKRAFSTGFAFDLSIRTGNARGRDAGLGDKRVVFYRHGDAYVATLYDYVQPEAPADAGATFASDISPTRLDRVVRLPPETFGVAVREDVLGVNLTTLDDPTEGFDEPPTLPDGLPDTPTKRPKNAASGPPKWTAEVFLPWSTLGFAEPPKEFRGDVSIMAANAAGDDTATRTAWSSVATPAGDAADEGLEAAILPGSWGTFRQGKSK